MKPSAVLDRHREDIRALVAARKALNPRVFGSVARGEDREDSDIDILVDALPDATLLDLGGLQYDLQEMLGVKVDLSTSTELHRRIRDRVLSEARPI